MGNNPSAINVHVNLFSKDQRKKSLLLFLSVEPTDTVASIKRRIRNMAGIPESYQKLSYKSQIWKDNKNLAHYKISEEEITINVEITISPDKILPQKFPQLPGEYLKLPKEKKTVTFMQQG